MVKFTYSPLDYLKLTEHEGNLTEDCRQESDYSGLIENSLQSKYNEVLAIIQENLPQGKGNKLFEVVERLPPEIFNENAVDLHLEVNNPYKIQLGAEHDCLQ